VSSLRNPVALARLTETWLHRPAAPLRLVLGLTRRCNLRCTMCGSWRLEPGHELAPDEVHRLLSQMPGLTWLDLTGGEPFVRADLADVLAAVLAATPALRVLHFPTNGWFTAAAVAAARQVRRARPDLTLAVTVSIDGERDLHDRIRGRRGGFDRAVATLRALLDAGGVDVHVGTTVTRQNAPALAGLAAALAREAPALSPRRWHWNWPQRSRHYYGNEGLDLAVPGGDELIRDQIRRRGRPRDLVDLMELAFLVNLESFQRGEDAGVPCQALRSAGFVSPEGDLYPCIVYDRCVGNLRGRSVAELWRAPEALAARADIERLACGGCFTPCEAYPMLAGAPLRAAAVTLRRALRLLPTVL
jgi:MoaA/NifB/PqqE/SkfB family radical SAM enzyme